MSRILHATRPVQRALLATVLAGLLVPAAALGAGSEIEGVWSFNGGAVDIVSIPGGKFEGIVTVQTQFASCPHLVEERMWTDITPQPDGSYWGRHQWFHGAPECAKNTTLGATAWRVMREPNGSRYLRVCFGDPGSAQPTISADGAPKEPAEYAAHHVSYGCVNSGLIQPLPGTQGSAGNSGPAAKGGVEALTLRKANQCLRPGLFKIRLHDPKYDPFKKVTVSFGGHKVAISRKGAYVVATINLKHVKKGRFTVKIHATTLLGHKLTATRTYRICPKKAKHHGKPHKRG
ncbi:MAG TPA: hypothetical protein VGI76_03750 [Solirubrobacteraceae bacterium]|jgi:hypothetical protein